MSELEVGIFIISWPGRHENASAIAQALADYESNVAIVYSDPDPSFVPNGTCRMIRRSHEFYWTDKFLACLEVSPRGLMIILHADCTCEDWEGLVRCCIDACRARPDIGIWAPTIRGTQAEIERTRIASIPGTTLHMCAQTDAICFAITQPVMERMRRADYSQNVYGWGIGAMMISSAYCSGLLVVVDGSVIVHHPVSSGYSRKEAFRQAVSFLRQLTHQEAVMYKLLVTFIQKHDADPIKAASAYSRRL